MPQRKNHRDGKPSAMYGSVDLLILRVLDLEGPLHGLEISQRIGSLSDQALLLEEGALYPALHRLERKLFLEGEWRISDRGRRAKFYQLTSAGSEALAREISHWTSHTAAVDKVLALPPNTTR